MHLYSICMSYHVVCKNSNTTVGVCGAGTAYHLKGHMSSCTHGFYWDSRCSIVSFLYGVL